MKSKRFVLGLFLLAALALTAADAGLAQSRPEVTEEFHQTYPLAGGGRVALSNLNGSVKVFAWERNEVKVDAVKRAYTQERLSEAKIKVDASPSRVRIETEYPEYRWSDRDGERHENPASVEYTLTVPRAAIIDEIDLVNGGLSIEGVTGPVHASSVNGRVVAAGLTGAVNLSVVNGRLEASLDRLNDSGTVSLSAVNGALVVTIPSDSNALLHADTVHGQISNDFNLPVREGEYVGRDLEGRLGQGGAHVRLSNVNGSITIRRANDNRPLSQATNLLSETGSREDFEGGSDAAEAARDAREAAREVAREARDAAREAAREAERDKRETLSDAERERRDAEREKADAEREKADAERERADAEREASREIDEAAQEIAREASRAAREAERASKIITNENLKERIKHGVDDSVRGGGSARQIERESNTYNVTGAPRVRVETFDGAVNVHTWDKAEVMYTATKRASDEHEMKGIRLQAQAAGGEVTLRAEFDKTFARSYHEHDGRVTSYASNASAEYDLYVPRNAALFVSSGDGRLRVDGVNGELDLHTGDGAIDVTGSRGRLRAQTGDGRIRVENFEGDADARTGDGRVTLDGNFHSLTARTGDGTIALSLPEGLNATVETDAESVFNDGVAVAETANEQRVRRWRVGSGGQVFTLRTGGGQVILRRR
ncbi:MAG: hypothetical protein QOC99_2090 [Acidobacteriota bacterium]|jgi:DUF4097 and DUF4098 domain-containing protein YvlB|nr:hypothetical protein [Acidobacteriota bacterium]